MSHKGSEIPARVRLAQQSGPARNAATSHGHLLKRHVMTKARWVSCGAPDSELQALSMRFRLKNGKKYHFSISFQDANALSYWIREWIELTNPEFLCASMGGLNAFPETKSMTKRKLMKAAVALAAAKPSFS